MSTITKQVRTAIREHILDSFSEDGDSLHNLREQVQHSRCAGESDYTVGARMVDDGFFLVYYDDIREWLDSIHPTEKRFSDSQVWSTYKHLIGREVAYLLQEGK
jgi:hypothetical protein